MDNESFCRGKSVIRLVESGIRATHELYPHCRSGEIRLAASGIHLIIKSIICSMSGVLTRAESRALRMTAENGSCAFGF